MSGGRSVKSNPMSVDEFLAWVPDAAGRWELVDGAPVAMAPERYIHASLKFRIARNLADAIERAGLDCEAMVDGMGVRVAEDAFYQPDVFVRCGPRPRDDQLEIDDPLIVVEVASPSTARRDETTKMFHYLSLTSVHHYLLVDPAVRRVGHYERRDDGTFLTRIWGAQSIPLDPPGIVLPAVF